MCIVELAPGLRLHVPVLAPMYPRARDGKSHRVDASTVVTQVSLLTNVELFGMNIDVEA